MVSTLPAEQPQPPEPAWRRRAVERSTAAAKRRAEQRIQRFLDAAQELISEKGTTDFTVQEIVERSKQSLRSFYQHFDGKHELLLALFEDALSRSAVELQEAVARQKDPIKRLKTSVELLYQQSRPRVDGQSPLFTDFALQLLVRHPDQVATAHQPLLEFFTDLVQDAADAGVIASERPRRTASLVMQTAMLTAQTPGADSDASAPLTAEEVWHFCLGGISGATPRGKRTA
jgi:AcrR family transcriptional regulator